MFRFNPLKGPLRRPFFTPTNIMKSRMKFRFSTSAGAGTQNGGNAKKSRSLKDLMKEYGYSALGVYMGLSAIDFPLCYILVHSMGTEEIEHYENRVKQQFGYGMSNEELEAMQAKRKLEEVEDVPSDKPKTIFSSFLAQFSWTEVAIAYGLHKSLIFIRVPICAAITPGIVKALRGWGFKIGTDKLAKTASIAKDVIKDAANPVAAGVRSTKKSRWFGWFI